MADRNSTILNGVTLNEYDISRTYHMIYLKTHNNTHIGDLMSKALLSITLLTSLLFSATSELPTEINSDTTFSDTVYVKTPVQIREGARLTLLAGTILLGESGASISCDEGSIISEGTARDSVFITSINSDKPWNGIRINDSSQIHSSHFSFTNIYNSNTTGLYAGPQSKIVVTNSVIRNNLRDGIFLSGASLEMISSKVLNNGSGAGIIAYGGETLLCTLLIKQSKISGNGGSEGQQGGISISNGLLDLQNCSIDSNTSSGFGGGLTLFNVETKIKDCAIKFNVAGHDGGGIYATNNSDISIINTTISDNISKGSGGGLYAMLIPMRIVNSAFLENSAIIGGGIHTNSCNYEILQSTLWKNSADSGSALSLTADTISMINCEIIENYNDDAITIESFAPPTNASLINCTFVSNPGGIVSTEESFLAIHNTIMWNNLAGSFPGVGPTDHSYLFLEEEQSEFPRFNDPLQNDFTLHNTSPCINSGTPDTTGLATGIKDSYGLARIVGNRIDLGAHECQNPVSLNKTVPKNSLLSISQSGKNISIRGVELNKFTVNLYNLKGQILFSQQLKELSSQVSLSLPHSLSKGSYILSLSQNGKQELHKKININ